MACTDRAHTDLSFRGAGSAGCVNLPALRLGRNDERQGFVGSTWQTSRDGDHHGRSRHEQDGDHSREHRDTGCQCSHQAIAAGPEGCPMGRHGGNCRSRLHDTSSSTGPRAARSAYSAAPARNAAMSMTKPAAIHSSSVGMIDNMTTRTGGSRTRLQFSVARAHSGSRFLPCQGQNCFCRGPRQKFYRRETV